MFESARLKLTFWYLFIIMLVSVFFSLFIYRVADNELVRIDRRQQILRERFRIEIFQPRSREEFNVPIDIDDLRHRIIFMLAFVNLGILVVAGGAGYFLAGKTLTPIKEMLDEQNRFISDASHELRTPLTSLKSAMEVHLRDKKLTLKDAKSLIAENITDVDKLQSLSDALLSLAQYQATNNHRSFSLFDVKDIVALAVKKISFLAKKKQITFNIRTENFKVEGNKEGLTDLLVILLDNAIKYSSPKKNVFIQTEKTDGSVLISVKDQGIGINKKDLPFIFDRFYRSETSRSKTTAGGYGLGLSIAKKIVTLHRGNISVESKVNTGTTFTIRLPAS